MMMKNFIIHRFITTVSFPLFTLKPNDEGSNFIFYFLPRLLLFFSLDTIIKPAISHRTFYYRPLDSIGERKPDFCLVPRRRFSLSHCCQFSLLSIVMQRQLCRNFWPRGSHIHHCKLYDSPFSSPNKEQGGLLLQWIYSSLKGIEGAQSRKDREGIFLPTTLSQSEDTFCSILVSSSSDPRKKNNFFEFFASFFLSWHTRDSWHTHTNKYFSGATKSAKNLVSLPKIRHRKRTLFCQRRVSVSHVLCWMIFGNELNSLTQHNSFTFHPTITTTKSAFVPFFAPRRRKSVFKVIAKGEEGDKNRLLENDTGDDFAEK